MTAGTQRRDDLIAELRKQIEARDQVITGLNRALTAAYEETAELRAKLAEARP